MAQDLFSKQAAGYSKWRPTYPPELVEYVAGFAKHHDIAWDCATGNGQAALLLADHFEKIYATDLSTEQLKHAKPHPKIEYSQSTAEHSGFADNTFDLVTVAQAYHWLDHAAFAKEVRRVCKPEGIIAIWAYGMSKGDDPQVNQQIQDFYKSTDAYWEAGRKYIDERYATVPFDYDELKVDKTFFIETQWNIHQLEGYLNSWSATQKFIKVNGYNPIDEFIKELQPHWKKDTITFKFPLYLRIGRV